MLFLRKESKKSRLISAHNRCLNGVSLLFRVCLRVFELTWSCASFSHRCCPLPFEFAFSLDGWSFSDMIPAGIVHCYVLDNSRSKTRRWFFIILFSYSSHYNLTEFLLGCSLSEKHFHFGWTFMHANTKRKTPEIVHPPCHPHSPWINSSPNSLNSASHSQMSNTPNDSSPSTNSNVPSVLHPNYTTITPAHCRTKKHSFRIYGNKETTAAIQITRL